MVLAFGIALCTILELSQLASIFFYASFIVLFVSLLLTLDNSNPHKRIVIGIIMFSIFSMLINGLVDTNYFSLSNIVFFLVFVSVILYVYLLQSVHPTKSLCNFIMLVGMGFSVLFPVAYVLIGISPTETFLTLNFPNPNLLGLWLLPAILFALVGIWYYRPIPVKILCAVMVAINLYLIILSTARNIWIALMLGVIVFVLSIGKKHQLPNWVFVLVVVFPLLFLFAYLLTIELWENSAFLQMFFEQNEKTMDTRVNVWESCLYHLGNHWITGRYFFLCGNAHNSHLVILCSYGVIVLILTMIYLYKVMKLINQNSTSAFQKACLIAFCIILFSGNAEGSLFSGAVGLHIPTCVFLFLAKYDPSKELEEETAYTRLML